MVDELRVRGVDTSGIRVTGAEPTAFTVSVSSARDRAFLTYAERIGSFRECCKGDCPGRGDPGSPHSSGARHESGSGSAVVSDASAIRGCSLSLDVGWHPEWFADPHAIAALNLMDIFFPNEREAAAMTRETDPRRMLEAFQEMGLRQVALKLGAEGAALLWDGEITFQKAGPSSP